MKVIIPLIHGNKLFTAFLTKSLACWLIFSVAKGEEFALNFDISGTLIAETYRSSVLEMDQGVPRLQFVGNHCYLIR